MHIVHIHWRPGYTAGCWRCSALCQRQLARCFFHEAETELQPVALLPAGWGSENYRPQEMATFEMFNKHPEELWKWYHMRWSICRNAAPNAGHAAVVDLEKLITTQEGYR